MKFELKRPCKHCPFRSDRDPFLQYERAAEIRDTLLSDGTFSCHETNEFTEDGDALETRESQHCAGALIALEHMEKPNQLMRTAERLGFYDRSKLDMAAPVFKDLNDWVEEH